MDDLIANRVADELGDGMKVQFEHDVGAMCLGRFHTDAQETGDFLVALSFCQKLHRSHETKLLPPFTECDAHVFLEESLHGPLAGAGYFAELPEWPRLRRIGQERLGDSERSWIVRVRKL